MRTLSLALAVAIGLVGLCSAQTEKPITTWKALDQPNDEFSLEVPAGFEFGMPGLPFDKIQARGEFHTDSDRLYIFIDSPKKQDQRKQVEAFLKYSNQDTSNLNLDDHVASRTEFQDSTGYYHRVIFVKTEGRVFSLQTVSSSSNSEVARRFLNSFQLRPKPATNSPQAEPDAVVSSGNKAVPVRETATPVGIPPTRSGGGISGGDTGTGRTAGGVSASAAQQVLNTTPLRITFKLKAQYSEFARFYSIQGTVTLRVTFSASGQIGSVTIIKKLPFGLTEAAIDSERQMRFEPEVVNGVARTTTRPVSFTFNIY
jgi:TonB family protein